MMTTFFIYGGYVPSESVFAYFLGGDVPSDVSVRINLENPKLSCGVASWCSPLTKNDEMLSDD